MNCLVVVHDDYLAVLCSITNKTQDMKQITETRVYISLLPAFTSILSSSHIIYTDSILNSTLHNLHKTQPLVLKHTQ
jgi:hypothetical protein